MDDKISDDISTERQLVKSQNPDSGKSIRLKNFFSFSLMPKHDKLDRFFKHFLALSF
jgi:hypothetical protein